MYIRTTSRKNKDGSVTKYVQLAHNVWDPKAGCAKAEVIYSFGRADTLDVEALKRLMRSIGRFLDPAEACALQSGNPDQVEVISSKAMGGAWVLDSLWKELDIDKALLSAARSREFTTPVERAIFAMVADRALCPSSKLAMEEWVEKDVVIPGLPSCQVQQLYRAMDFLLECSDEIQWAVFSSCAHLLNLEVDLIYFDTTSMYFQVEDEDDPGDLRSSPRRRGKSKDRRDDLPQVVIGLAVTREGIPIRCWCWPGNTVDMSVIQQVKEDLVGWKLGRVISVVDRGFASEENLRYLQRAGGHYIAGKPMRRGVEKVGEALSRVGRYSRIKDNLEVKEIIVGDGEARTRYILVRNPEQAKRDKAERDKLIAELKEKLSSIKRADEKEHTKAICALVSSEKYGRYLTDTRRGLPKIDYGKVREEEKLDGRYLLRTSDDTLSAEDVVLGYKQLIEVEEAFRTLKSTLDMRPVYHWLDDRIRAHVMLCWLALLLVRVAETRAKDTWRNMRRELQRMHLTQLKLPGALATRRTETTAMQAQIFKSLGVKEPPKVWDISPSKPEARIS